MGRFSFEWGSPVVPTPISVERDIAGNWFYEMWNNIVGDKKLVTDKEKLNAVLCNPAALKVFKLNCDLFSLGNINKYEGDKEIEKNYLYSVKKRPNFFQTWTQFNWDYMFWTMLGTAYLYRSNNVFNDSTQLYWLNPAHMDWGDNWKKKLSKFIFSVASFNQLERETVKYKWPDGTETNIPLSQITPFHDLSNGISGNWYKGESALDALYKVIRNSDIGLDSKGENLFMSQQFAVSGQVRVDQTTQLPMGADEERDIQIKLKRKGKIVTKSPVDIKRFVDDIAALKLDESYSADLLTIGSMYQIPREVLDAIAKGSTYENQEKATGRHVDYALKPKAQALTDAYESLFGWQDLRMSWDHLLFNQVFAKDKAERQAIQLDNLTKAKELGAYTDQEAKDAAKLIMTS